MKNKIYLSQQKGKKENLLRRLRVGHNTYGQEVITITIYIFPKHFHMELHIPIKPKYLVLKGQQGTEERRESGSRKLQRLQKMTTLCIPIPFLLP